VLLQKRSVSLGGSLLEKIWSLLSRVSTSTLYLLFGITITISMFEARWLAIFIAITAVVASRTALLGVFFIFFKYSRWETAILSVGGIRGVSVAAMALSLPEVLPGWWTLQAMAYGLVIFSLFVQYPLLNKFI